jgi:hypothetical protein
MLYTLLHLLIWARNTRLNTLAAERFSLASSREV